MDLAKCALSAALYFVPPKVLAKLKPTITAVFDQLRVLSGGEVFSQSSHLASSDALQCVRDGTAGWQSASAPLIRSPSDMTGDALDLPQRSNLRQRRPKTTISVTVKGCDGPSDGVTLNFPIPADTKSAFHVSFQESDAGGLDIAFSQGDNSIDAVNAPLTSSWRGVTLNGVGQRGLGPSQPTLARDVVAYLELLYCLFFVGEWVLKAVGPLLEWARSVSKVVFAELVHWGAFWLARLLRLILASLPEEA